MLWGFSGWILLWIQWLDSTMDSVVGFCCGGSVVIWRNRVYTTIPHTEGRSSASSTCFIALCERGLCSLAILLKEDKYSFVCSLLVSRRSHCTGVMKLLDFLREWWGMHRTNFYLKKLVFPLSPPQTTMIYWYFAFIHLWNKDNF